MLTVTDRAAALLRDIQAEQEESKDKVLRLTNQGGQLELAFDMAKDEDQVFKSEEASVLLVAPEVGALLDDATIDVQDTPEGPRLTLSSASASSGSE
jgi:Fe-S cluster assembly iron-binding protein IscA